MERNYVTVSVCIVLTSKQQSSFVMKSQENRRCSAVADGPRYGPHLGERVVNQGERSAHTVTDHST